MLLSTAGSARMDIKVPHDHEHHRKGMHDSWSYSSNSDSDIKVESYHHLCSEITPDRLKIGLERSEILTTKESTRLRSEATQLSGETFQVACRTIILLAVLLVSIANVDRSCEISYAVPLCMTTSLSLAGILAMIDKLSRMTDAEAKAKEEANSGMHLYMDIETLQKGANPADVAAIRARQAKKLMKKPVVLSVFKRIPAYGWIMLISVLVISLIFIFSFIQMLS